MLLNDVVWTTNVMHCQMRHEDGNKQLVLEYKPVTVVECSKAWTLLARSDAGIVGSDPTRGMDVYVNMYVYSMFVLSCVGRGLAMSWSLVQGVLPSVLD
jgi:hypothetical protein